MVRAFYLVDGVHVTEEEFHNFRLNHEDAHSLDCYCECLECGRKLLICELCACEFENEY